MTLKQRLDAGWSYLAGWDNEWKSYVCTMWRPLNKDEETAQHNQTYEGSRRRVPVQFKHVWSSRETHSTLEAAIEEALNLIPKDLL